MDKMGAPSRFLFQTLIACLLAQSAWARPRAPDSDMDLLPGWKSETHVAKAPKPKVPRMVTLHEEARIFLFEHFLTDEECDHIISLAKPRMARSGVVDTKTGGSDISDIRTSTGTFLERGEDPIVAEIEERIARWTLLPVGNGEGLQVLRYGLNQKYDGHYDYFFDKQNIQNGGNRYATVLTYLNDVEEGGETVFPNIPAPGGDNGPGFSECARHHLAARPRKGSAVLFHSIAPNGELERRSLHTACPVIKGEKWSMPKWIHVGHYARGNETPKFVGLNPQTTGGPPGCVDRDDSCPLWASSGECEANAGFMVGSHAHPGQCIKSCQRCDMLLQANPEGAAPRIRRSMPFDSREM